MKLKNYLLVEGKAIRVGIDMTRVFISLAGKRVPWFSLIHQDEVRSSSDIARVHLSYAYYNLDGKIDMTQHSQEAAQLIDKWFKRSFPSNMTLQAKVSKDLGIPISINLLLHTVSQS